MSPRVPVILSLSDTLSGHSLLHSRWNLIAFPSFDKSYSVSGLKAENGVTRVEDFDSWSLPHSLKALTFGGTLQTGFGYWTRMEYDTVWIIEIS